MSQQVSAQSGYMQSLLCALHSASRAYHSHYSWKVCPEVPKSTPVPCITITVLISDYLLKRSTWCHECIWSHQLGFGITGERKEVCWHRQISDPPQVWLGAVHRLLFRSQPFRVQISHVVWKSFKGGIQISLELPSKTKALIP